MTRLSFRRSLVASKFSVVSARTVASPAECKLRRAQGVAQSRAVLTDRCKFTWLSTRNLPPSRNRDRLRVTGSGELATTYTGTALQTGYLAPITTGNVSMSGRVRSNGPCCRPPRRWCPSASGRHSVLPRPGPPSTRSAYSTRHGAASGCGQKTKADGGTFAAPIGPQAS
jgi:hypothetical protein